MVCGGVGGKSLLKMSGETLFWGGLEHFEFCPEGTDLEWHYGRELKNVIQSDNDHSDIENRVREGLFWTWHPPTSSPPKKLAPPLKKFRSASPKISETWSHFCFIASCLKYSVIILSMLLYTTKKLCCKILYDFWIKLINVCQHFRDIMLHMWPKPFTPPKI